MEDIEESVNDSVNQDQFLGSSKGKTIKSQLAGENENLFGFRCKST